MQCGSTSEFGKKRYRGVNARIAIIMRFFYSIVLFLVAFCSQAQTIFSADYANQADVKVFVFDSENQCDLKVFKVVYANQDKGNEGLWYFVE